jgi:hypothetical protein
VRQHLAEDTVVDLEWSMQRLDAASRAGGRIVEVPAEPRSLGAQPAPFLSSLAAYGQL